ncbi:MAG: DNA-directed RNA polymerase subunit beta, partial [Nannocystaceae bacterium]
ANLDEAGVVRIGAEVKAGDILVGKITPKGETQLSPEEKLLRAIFGEKAGDVRDTSLRLPPGVSGIVIDARVFARKGVDKDSRAQQIEDAEREKLIQDRHDNVAIVSDGYQSRMRDVMKGKVTAAKLVDDDGNVVCESGVTVTAEALNAIPRKYWSQMSLTTAEDTELVEALGRRLEKDLDEIETIYREKIAKLTKSDELPPGVIKMVKVYVAIKRKMQVGDKMAGRHGNKGVISRILPIEDLPYLEDGTPVDLVLNPLGVPSRMNVGQILEVHLGWAAHELGKQINRYMQTNYSADVLRNQLKKIYEVRQAQKFVDSLTDDDIIRFADKLRRGVHMSTPVFDGALETEVKHTLTKAGLPDSGQAILLDGRTGHAFEENVTVGIMYMLKLHHLVDDKIHARSIGPYSLVTQQPLGGKAQFGGQRLGEMEVWALEAYGAAFA